MRIHRQLPAYLLKLHKAELAGRAAKAAGEPSSANPYVNSGRRSNYVRPLMDAWARGWHWKPDREEGR